MVLTLMVARSSHVVLSRALARSHILVLLWSVAHSATMVRSTKMVRSPDVVLFFKVTPLVLCGTLPLRGSLRMLGTLCAQWLTQRVGYSPSPLVRSRILILSGTPTRS